MDMPEADKRFRGQARLVRLLLWKVGETTNVSRALEVALAQGMINSDDAQFLDECMAAEERGREGGDLGRVITADDVSRLQRIADKLNRADSA